MNRLDLIKLGAMAQKEYNLFNYFEIIEVMPKTSRYIIPVYKNDKLVCRDTIVLEDFVVYGSQQVVSMGYSKLANTLVVSFKESER